MAATKKKIVLLAYFFSPDKRVGALRMSYWFRFLERNTNYEVVVITANKEAEGENVIVIPHKTQISKFFPIKDDGVSWKKDVVEYLEKDIVYQAKSIDYARCRRAVERL